MNEFEHLGGLVIHSAAGHLYHQWLTAATREDALKFFQMSWNLLKGIASANLFGDDPTIQARLAVAEVMRELRRPRAGFDRLDETKKQAFCKAMDTVADFDYALRGLQPSTGKDKTSLDAMLVRLRLEFDAVGVKFDAPHA